MSQRTLRIAILVLGLFTAIVHLIVLPLLGGFFPLSDLDYLFLLNGAGYFVLLTVFFTNPQFDRGRTPLLHYAFMGYALATIIAWFLLGDMSDKLAWVTKLDEVLLIVALFLDMRAEQKAA
jgi:hypothetical protein